MPTTLTLQPTGQQVVVPCKWSDCTFQQFVDLVAPEPDEQRSAAEILCSLEAGAFLNLALQDVELLTTLLAFAQDSSDVTSLLPTPGLRPIGELAYGSLLLCTQHIQASPNRPWLAYAPYILAVYRQTMLWGNADNASKLDACEAAILAAPCTEVYADASFFLTQYKNYTSASAPTPKTSSTSATKRKKRGLATSANASRTLWDWMRRRKARS